MPTMTRSGAKLCSAACSRAPERAIAVATIPASAGRSRTRRTRRIVRPLWGRAAWPPAMPVTLADLRGPRRLSDQALRSQQLRHEHRALGRAHLGVVADEHELDVVRQRLILAHPAHRGDHALAAVA